MPLPRTFPVDKSASAMTVTTMSFRGDNAAPAQAMPDLRALALGDLVTLPAGDTLTVRAVERRLKETSGSMTGFVLAGEIGPDATLLSIPADPSGTVVLYAPVREVPVAAADVTQVCWGVVSYWPPHLPGLSGAMAELTYRVFRVRGQLEPMVVLWRGNERVVFVLSGTATPDMLDVRALRTNPAVTEQQVARHSSLVTDPAYIPAPEPAPARKLTPIGR